MKSLMNGAVVTEATLLSFFLALWMARMCLSSLFRLLPGTSRTVTPSISKRAGE